MKKHLEITVLLAFLTNCLLGQIFTPVTDGEIFNDSSALSSSWGDFDNDGWEDLFNSRFQLYRNDGIGEFIKITSGDVVENGIGITGTWGDYDHDGYLDLYVPATGSIKPQLYHNNGDATFTQILDEPFLSDSSDMQGASWVDIENDGDLDLYVATGGNEGFKNNLLYINQGDGTFKRDPLNLIALDSSGTTHCGWGDYNNDGFSDVFLAHGTPGIDGVLNHLYQNNGDGSFTRIQEGSIVTDSDLSLGGSWGDYNNDGFLDIVVTNFGFNKLYRNDGDGNFTSVSISPITTNDNFSIGSDWLDLDNDGDLDLIIANPGGTNAFYRNDGNDVFNQLNSEPAATHDGFALSSADWDKDGDLDVLFTNSLSFSGSHRPYLNNGNVNHWLNIHCVGVWSNTSAIGAKVRIKAIIFGQEVWQLREISGQTGVLSQSSLNAHFGLGDAEVIDSIQIEWPSGIVQILTDHPTNLHIEVIEDTTLVSTKEVLPQAPITAFEIFPNPMQTNATIQFEVSKSTSIDLKLLNTMGQTVQILAEDWQAFSGKHQFNLTTDGLAGGVYFCQLRVGHQMVLTKRVVKGK